MVMKADDLKQSPKLFAENIKLAYTPEYFVLGISSGQQAQFYSLSPAHTKRLSQYLAHELAEFEKTHGAIETEWTPNIVSPVQPGKPPSQLS